MSEEQLYIARSFINKYCYICESFEVCGIESDFYGDYLIQYKIDKNYLNNNFTYTILPIEEYNIYFREFNFSKVLDN